jgi:hypothetical protein
MSDDRVDYLIGCALAEQGPTGGRSPLAGPDPNKPSPLAGPQPDPYRQFKMAVADTTSPLRGSLASRAKRSQLAGPDPYGKEGTAKASPLAGPGAKPPQQDVAAGYRTRIKSGLSGPRQQDIIGEVPSGGRSGTTSFSGVSSGTGSSAGSTAPEALKAGMQMPAEEPPGVSATWSPRAGASSDEIGKMGSRVGAVVGRAAAAAAAGKDVDLPRMGRQIKRVTTPRAEKTGGDLSALQHPALRGTPGPTPPKPSPGAYDSSPKGLGKWQR